jgi:Icc protein
MTPISVLQITDLHIQPGLHDTFLGINTEYYFNAILDFAFTNAHPIDLIIVTGDLAQDPCPASYLRILKSLESYNTPSICIPGNHDDYALMQQIFCTDKVNCQRHISIDNWQLICLNSQIQDSPNGYLPEQELLFLEDCLSNTPDQHTLIAVHHHCLMTDSAWLDTMIIKNRIDFLSILRKYPQVKAITTGHIHQSKETITDGILVLGSPSTCFQFKPHSKEFSLDTTQPGYRMINLCTDGHIESSITLYPEPLHGLQIHTRSY